MKNKLFIILIITIIIIGVILIDMKNKEESNTESEKPAKISGNTEKAIFAGGCFWCMEAAFQELPGVASVISGYTGGSKENPTYQEVIEGNTGHYEAIEIIYDPKKISYEELLNTYWRNIDPTDETGQFVDKGTQYKTAIFYNNETQKDLAEKSKKELDSSGKLDKPIVTKILPEKIFYKAEDYHQNYYKKRFLQYQIYEKGSGRVDKLEELWE